MDAKALLQQAIENDIYLYVESGKLKFKAAAGAMSESFKAQIKVQMDEIIELLSTKDSSDRVASLRPKISPLGQQQAALSFAQQRLWFIDHLQGGSAQYNISLAIEVKGDFVLDVAEEALCRIIRRHKTLRTVFVKNEEQPTQVILEEFTLDFRRLDFSALEEDEQSVRVAQQIEQESQHVFDLSNGLPLRVCHVQLSCASAQPRSLLLFTVHHIAADGWSMGVLFDEFVKQYSAIQQGNPDPFPPLSIQYADYAHWQRQWLQGDVLERQLTYWQTQLADIPTVHRLPLDQPRPEVKSHEGGVVTGRLPAEVSAGLQRLAQTHELTEFMVLHGVLSWVLSRHSGERECVIGTAVANRLDAELEPLIGFFVNTLVLRVRTDIESLPEYWRHVRQVNLDAQSHQDIPFEQLVEHCQVARSLQHTPLFQIMFSMNTTEAPELQLPGVTLNTVNGSAVTAKFDLDISAKMTSDGVQLRWVYDKSLFSMARVQRFNDHVMRVLQALTETASVSTLSALPMLSAQEVHQLVYGVNETQQSYSDEQLLHGLFESQVEKTPDAVALIDTQGSMSYQALNQAANRLAHYLREQGVQRETLVGICVSRSREVVVALLAVLKAGGAYVPLEPQYPEARLTYQLQDSGLSHLLTEAAFVSKLTGCYGQSSGDELTLTVLDSEALKVQLASYPEQNPARAQASTDADLAYVIYTSGSTGQPKGVMIEHGSVVNLAQAMAELPIHVAGKSWGWIASPVFDASIQGLSQLLMGCPLAIITDEEKQDSDLLRQRVERDAIGVMDCTPGLLSLWLSQGAETFLPNLVVGGEAISKELWLSLNELQQTNATVIFNVYGPTECTVNSSWTRVSGEMPHIGRMIPNTQGYVLDSAHQLVPQGTVGELCVGGVGVGRGYLHRDELTRERFIQHPFSDDQNARLYCTGDMVRRLPSGDFEYIGRADAQVKIRGFRIELGEVEHHLSAQAMVDSCVVVTDKDALGQQQLLAYVKPSGAVTDEDGYLRILSDELKQQVPSHLVPSVFVVVSEWPLNTSGKIDKSALPAAGHRSTQREYCPAHTATEHALVEIWGALLKVPVAEVSVTDNFFERGGHSLLAVRLVSEIRAQLQRELPVKAVFEWPTVRTLAAQLEEHTQQPVRSSITPLVRDGSALPVSFAQQRLWFIDRLQGGSAQYNIPVALQVEGAFDVSVAEQALCRIIHRHEPLRTTFSEQADEPVQHIAETFAFEIVRCDLSELEEDEQSVRVAQQIEQESQHVFDLSNGLPLRVCHVQLSCASAQPRSLLLFTVHHIAADGWSMGVLFDEFVKQYSAIQQGNPDPFPPLSIQYADYAHWQRQWLQGDVLERQLTYWQTQLADIPTVHRLPLDQPRPEVKSHEGGVVTGRLPAEVSAGLQRLAQTHELTEFMVLHGVLSWVLSRHSGERECVIGTAVANRLDAELEPLIGFFVNTLVLRVRTDIESLPEYWRHVRQVNLDAQSHQDIPFEQLVEHCQVARSLQHTPLFQIMFSMNTTEAPELQLPGVTLNTVNGSAVTAKFDLDISAKMTSDGVQLRWVYDKSLFSMARVQRFNDHVMRVLQALTETASVSTLSALPMLSAQEVHQLVYGVNETQQSYSDEQLLHGLFESQVEKTPDAVALIDTQGSMSYQALNQAANRLAHYLREQGVQRETLVGICVSRSREVVVALLAVLKAGGAYVPLEPQYPEARLTYQLQDSGLSHLLTEAAFVSKLTDCYGQSSGDELTLTVLDSEALKVQLASYPEQNPARAQASTDADLAYVIYTSGSTGQPKGVMIEHGSVVNLAQAMAELPIHVAGKSWGWIASPVFDASIQGLSQLLMGCPLAIITDEEKQDSDLLRQRVERDAIGVMDCTPGLLSLWLSQGAETFLPNLVVGGEAISKELWLSLNELQQTNATVIFNVYGPTECTVNSSWTRVSGEMPHIGRMIPNTQGYVLDSAHQLVPQGTVGELCVGGVGVGRGYLHRDELTRERFIQHPFSDDQNARLYCTGDMVRRLPSGDFEYIGRADAQVKIRGFRIELGEVEHHLSAQAMVDSCVVVTDKDALGQQQLLAYVKPSGAVTDEDDYLRILSDELKQQVPSHLVPSVFVVVSEWPLNTSGKIDKSALPAAGHRSTQREYCPAHTATEHALVEIWGALLKVPVAEVSVTDNFFERGGHSLLAVRLVSEIRAQLQRELPVKAVFEWPTVRTLAAQLEEHTQQPVRSSITPLVRDGSALPVSFAQQRLWFIDRLQGGSAQYNIPVALQVEGAFDVSVAEQALCRIIHRHEPLRTTFSEQADEPVQHIAETFAFEIVRCDLSELEEDEQSVRVAQQIEQESQHVFDLSNGLPLRVCHVQLSCASAQPRSLLLFTVHHIAADGWSMGVLFDEFVKQYSAIQQGNPDPFPPLSIQYADYAHWQRQWLQGDVLERQLTYWQTQLADIPTVHRLPLDQPRPEVKSHEGGVVTGRLPAEVSAGLQRLAQTHELTEFMVLHGVLSWVLSRHSGERECVIGTAVANRLDAELEPLIGFFVNTLVLRVRTDIESLPEYWRHVRQVNLDAQSHQDIPFEQLVEHCQVARSLQHTPLFQIMFSMNTTEAPELQLPGVTLNTVNGSAVTAKFDLDISAKMTSDGVQLRWVYDKSLFSMARVQRFNDHVMRVLQALTETASVSTLSALPMLSAQEVHQLVYGVNETQQSYSDEQLLHGLFESQVEKTPDAVALIDTQGSMSYQALNQAANRLAHYLREQGVQRETLVGICVSRSREVVVALLAVLKAGGAYVPLEPQYPEARLTYLLQDSGLSHLLTEAAFVSKLTDCYGQSSGDELTLTVLDSEALEVQLASYPEQNPARAQASTDADLAYVIYTSGSTGQPKGVMIEHGSVVNLAQAMAELPIHVAGKSWGWIASPVFDASIQGLSQLLMGCPLAIITDEEKQDSDLLRQRVERDAIGVMDCTPGLLSLWLSQGAETFLPNLMVGGEAISKELWLSLNELQQTNATVIFNLYGPTECTVNCCWTRVSGEMPHIGRMMPNTQGYVLDSAHQLVPQGTVGELCVGGVGVGRGYLHRDELTRERFIQHPFSDDQNARLYCTGDMVRRLPSGDFEYIGRADAQVKIRGFRIELGEVEHHLSAQAMVDSCVVVTDKDALGQQQLLAYVKPSGAVTDEDGYLRILSDELKQQVPSHLVPSVFVVVSEWPLNTSGKIDKSALPAAGHRSTQREYCPAHTATEHALVEIWGALLKVPVAEVSVTDNFFERGGHSLLAVRLVSEIRAQLQRELPVKAVFEWPTVRTLAAQLEEHTQQPVRSSITPLVRDGSALPVSFAQQRLWFIDRLQGGSAQYNIPVALQVEGAFDVSVAEQALCRIIHRHEPLRTTFSEQADEPVQHIAETFAFEIVRCDLSELEEDEQSVRVAQQIEQESQHVFDLSNGLPLRVCHVQLSCASAQPRSLLLFTVHHIAADGWSMGVLFDEFVKQYSAIQQGNPDPFPPLSIQYADYAHWQRQWLQGDVLERQLTYWQTQLADIPTVHRLPLDQPRPEVKSHEGGVVTGRLPAEVSAGLQRLAQTHELTEFMVLHGVLSWVLSRHSGERECVIGTAVANRLDAELEPLIGFFVNTLVLRVRTDIESLPEYWRHVRQVNLDAQSHQDIPFEQLVEHCQVARSLQHTPLFQIMFSMNTTEAPELQLPGVTLNTVNGSAVTAKFDLDISAKMTSDGVQLRWVYDKSLFSMARVQRFNDHVMRVLQALTETASVSTLSALPMLSAQEVHQLVYGVNETQQSYSDEQLLHGLFESQVEKTPDAVALIDTQGSMSYQALNQAANRLAHYLREQGVQRETLVGICVSRSREVVVALLAVLKAGGAYVPLEPQYPEARLTYQLQDSGLSHLLTEAAFVSKLTDCYGQSSGDELTLTVLDSEALKVQLASYPEQNPARAQASTDADLAYVIYTSGSTGQPKGVMIEHGSVVNLAQAMAELPIHVAGKSWGWIASPVFDASIQGLSQLLMGCPLAIITDEEKQDSDLLRQRVERDAIGVMDCTPGLLSLWLSQGAETFLPNLVVGGEAISKELWLSLNELQQTNATVIFNVYGPTECTVNSSWTRVSGEMPHIGRMIPNTQGYVLDSAHQLVPQGTVGELCVGGVGVGRGYLHRDELTRERFIQHPFSDDQNARLYCTGDMVRRLPSGDFEYIGRADAQVKIRGFRIELGEVEHHLSAQAMVDSCVVVTDKDALGQQQLLAYVKPSGAVTDEDGYLRILSDELKQQVPSHLVPSVFVVVSEWPLNTSGKIDTKALASMDKSQLNESYTSPDNPTEHKLTAIWAELFNLPANKLSTTANFFDLGGHSLMAAILISKVNKALGSFLTVKDIFQYQTVKDMGTCIEHGKWTAETDNHIVLLKEGNKEALPLFLIHPVGGSCYPYRQLTRGLRYEGMIYGIQALGDESTIESMAEKYVAEIAERQPQGKCLLAGWSMGGVVAFEVAQQLIKKGREVEKLVLIESFCPESNTASVDPMKFTDPKKVLSIFISELGIDITDVLESGKERLAEKDIEELISLLVALGKEQGRLAPSTSVQQIKERFDITCKNEQALKNYQPVMSTQPMELIRATGNVHPEISLGWAHVASDVNITEIEGDHFSIMRPPFVNGLIRVLNHCLNSEIK